MEIVNDTDGNGLWTMIEMVLNESRWVTLSKLGQRALPFFTSYLEVEVENASLSQRDLFFLIDL